MLLCFSLMETAIIYFNDNFGYVYTYIIHTESKKRKKSITIKETFTDFPQFAYINHRPFYTSAQVCVIPYVRFFLRKKKSFSICKFPIVIVTRLHTTTFMTLFHIRKNMVSFDTWLEILCWVEEKPF